MLPRLASSPERAVVGAKRAPSGVAAERAPSVVALSPSGVVSLPKHGIVVIVDNETRFVGVGFGSRGDSKREQVPLGRW